MEALWEERNPRKLRKLAGVGLVLIVLLAGCDLKNHKNRLTVSTIGSGSGAVTSSPAGIDCGMDCSESYSKDTVVTLTARPASDSTFAGWNGACTGTSSCTVSMDDERSVTATFTLVPRTLTMTKAGSGSGTVTSSPPGITCGTDCLESYASGTVVTLTATPASGSIFAGWSGAPDCTAGVVTMTANKTCTATFSIQRFTLTVTKPGNGSGTVTSNPAGITCGTDCSEEYKSGTGVTLTARPASDSTFAGWGGACTGTGSCSVSMENERAVTATFNAIPVIDFSALPERIDTNLATFFVSGSTPAGNRVTVNGIRLSTDSEGNFVTPVPLAIGANRLELVIESPQGERHSFIKIVNFDPAFSTAERRLLYVDSVAPDLLGTLVIDVDHDVFLGLLKDKHVRGIAPDGRQIYIHDRSVISTATHKELEAPFSPLRFTQDLPSNGFLVSPDGTRLYARDEILDLRTNRVLAAKFPVSLVTGSSFGGAPIPGGPTISADGQKIFCRTQLTIINTRDLSTVPTGIFGHFLSDIALTPDGRFLLFSEYSFATGSVTFLDAQTLQELATISGLGDFLGEIVFSTDGKKAIVGSAGNPRFRGGGVTVINTISFRRDFSTLIDLADNLAISDQDDVFVSSGNRLGIDVFALQADGTLVRTKSFFLGINRFVETVGIPTEDEIQKIIFKP